MGKRCRPAEPGGESSRRPGNPPQVGQGASRLGGRPGPGSAKAVAGARAARGIAGAELETAGEAALPARLPRRRTLLLGAPGRLRLHLKDERSGLEKRWDGSRGNGCHRRRRAEIRGGSGGGKGRQAHHNTEKRQQSSVFHEDLLSGPDATTPFRSCSGAHSAPAGGLAGVQLQPRPPRPADSRPQLADSRPRPAGSRLRPA